MINVLGLISFTARHPSSMYSVTCFVMSFLMLFLTWILSRAWPAIEKTYTSFIKGILRQVVAKHQGHGSSPSTANNYGGRQFSSNNSSPHSSNVSSPNSSNHSSVNPISNNNSNNSNQNNPSSENNGGDSSSDGRETNGVPDTNGADDNTGTKGRFNQRPGSNGTSTSSIGKPGTNGTSSQNKSNSQGIPGNDISSNEPNAENMVKNNNRQGGNNAKNNVAGDSNKNQAVKDNGNQPQDINSQPQGFSSILGNKAKNGATKGIRNIGSSIKQNAEHPGHMIHSVGNAAKGLGHTIAHPDEAAAHAIGNAPKNIGHGLSHVGHGIKSGVGAANNAYRQAQNQQVNGLGADTNNGQLSTDGGVTAPEAADYGRAADQMLSQSGGLNSKALSNNNSSSNAKNSSPLNQNSISSNLGSQSSAKNAMLQHGLNSRNNHQNSHRNGNKFNSSRKGGRSSRMLHNLNNNKRINSMRANTRKNGGKLIHSSQMQSLSHRAGSMHHINMPKTMKQAHRNIQSALGQHHAAQSALSNIENTPNVSPSQKHAAQSRVNQAGHHLKRARLAGSMLYESNPTNHNLVRPNVTKTPTNHQARTALSNVFHAQNNLVHAGKQHAPKATMKSLGTKLNDAKSNAKSIGLKPMAFSTRPQIASSIKTLNTGLANAISGYRPTPKMSTSNMPKAPKISPRAINR